MFIRTVLTLILYGLAITIIAQDIDVHNPIQTELNQRIKAHKSLHVYTPFSRYKNAIGQDIFKTNTAELMSSKEELIEISIPLSANKEINLILYPINLFKSSGIIWSKQNHYRGIIKGDNSSIVSLNINNDHITGIISNHSGDLIIQPDDTKSNSVKILKSKDRKPDQAWTCHNDEVNDMPESVALKEKELKSGNSTDTITVYLEADYAMYVDNNESVTSTMNYVLGVMNEVSALYANEQITLLIDDVKIWSTPDPYAFSSANSAISSFKSHLEENFEADFAQLLSSRDENNGGIAYINSLCDKTRAYSYSNVHGTYSPSNLYSWDVHVITHELGHNLGSYHTHDCIWGDNRQSLDDCVNNSCDGDIPTYAGTIMSYCHQEGQSGINFALGFGKLPGDLIRSRTYSCREIDGAICTYAVSLTETDTYHVQKMDHGYGANNQQGEHAYWFEFIPHTDGDITIGSCGMGQDTRVFMYSGSCESLTEDFASDDDCAHGASGTRYASKLDSIPVVAGATYYFEWDDRWDNDPFDISFEYNYEIVEDLCNNGKLDGDEEGVDCGGTSCRPCQECNSQENITGLDMIEDEILYRSNESIDLSSTIAEEGMLMASSGMEITLEPGFEVEIGGQLEALIESCENYYSRVQNID